MFDELSGLPTHPLIVHAAVVFVPLLVVGAVTYALIPAVRQRIAWAVVGLAVVAPLSAWLATQSGNRLRERLAGQGMSPELLARIDEHRDLGEQTLWASGALAVFALLAVGTVVTRGRRADTATGKGAMLITVVLTAGVLLSAVASAVFVFQTGESGARSVWGG